MITGSQLIKSSEGLSKIHLPTSGLSYFSTDSNFITEFNYTGVTKNIPNYKANIHNDGKIRE